MTILKCEVSGCGIKYLSISFDELTTQIGDYTQLATSRKPEYHEGFVMGRMKKHLQSQGGYWDHSSLYPDKDPRQIYWFQDICSEYPFDLSSLIRFAESALHLPSLEVPKYGGREAEKEYSNRVLRQIVENKSPFEVALIDYFISIMGQSDGEHKDIIRGQFQVFGRITNIPVPGLCVKEVDNSQKIRHIPLEHLTRYEPVTES